MTTLAATVKYFQTKLGNYDKQVGEHSVEQRILQGIESEDVQAGRTFLIDVDVVRGSVFTKNKPRHGWSQAVFLGILRAAFAPFHWEYWKGHMSLRWAAYIMLHFSLQFIQAVCFLLIDPDSTKCSQDDVIVPFLLAIGLGVLHSHITAAHGSASCVNVLGVETENKSVGLTNHVSKQVLENDHIADMHNTTRRVISSDISKHRRLRVGCTNPVTLPPECPMESYQTLTTSSVPPSHSDVHIESKLSVTSQLYGHEVIGVSSVGSDSETNVKILKQSSHAFNNIDSGNVSKFTEHCDLINTNALTENNINDSTDSTGDVDIDVDYRYHTTRSDTFDSPRGHEADIEESDSDSQHFPLHNYVKKMTSSRNFQLLNNVTGKKYTSLRDFGPAKALGDPNSEIDSCTNFSSEPLATSGSDGAEIDILSREKQLCSPNLTVSVTSALNPSLGIATTCDSKCGHTTSSLPLDTKSKFTTTGRKRCSSVGLPIDPMFLNGWCKFGSLLFPANSMSTSDQQRRLATHLSNSSLIGTFRTGIPSHVAIRSQYVDLGRSRWHTNPFFVGGFVLGPFSRIVHSSNSTLSSGASTSSAISRNEPTQTRAIRSSGLESIHAIDSGLGLRPNCYAKSHQFGSGLLGSFSKITTSLDRSTESRFKTLAPNYKPILSRSLINLRDGRCGIDITPLYATHNLVVSAPGSDLGQRDTHTMNRIKSDVMACDDKYTCSMKMPNQQCVNDLTKVTADNEDDTITTHSRQRAKFLRLFLHRASLTGHQQLRNTSKYTPPSGESPSVENQDIWINRRDTHTLSTRKHSTRDISSINATSTHDRYTNASASVSNGGNYSPKDYQTPSSSMRNLSVPARGLTTSETECDRINSDVGSDVDSSSAPDEVDLIPNPTGQCQANTFSSWTSGPCDQTMRVSDKMKDLKRTTLIKCRNSQRVRACSGNFDSRVHSTRVSRRPNFPVVPSEGSGVSDASGDAWAEQEPVSDSERSLESSPQPKVPSSNTEDGPRLVKPDYSHSPWSEVLTEDRKNYSTTMNKVLHNPSLAESISKTWNTQPSSLTDTVRCFIWEPENVSKFNLTVLDIGYNVIRAVERQGISTDYIMLGCVATVVLPLLSVAFHWNSVSLSSNATTNSNTSFLDPLSTSIETNTSPDVQSFWPSAFSDSLLAVYIRVLVEIGRKLWLLSSQPMGWLSSSGFHVFSALFWHLVQGRWFIQWLFEPDLQGTLVVMLGVLLRFNVYGIIFFLLCIAELTFQQRLLYAKYFFSLTSARRARKYRVPQFRLNKLSHVKCWLTLRSYLKKRGPQRSVETVIATTFYMVFLLGLGLCSQFVSRKEDSVLSHLTNWDMLGLMLAIMLFLHRFIMLGTKITKKYRNFSVLITEQINLYLSMEKKPQKKDELMATFQVLRLIEGLLKEVDGPFRVCGWTVNPLVYNLFKLVLLSCFSSLLSETLGFKLKLYKLKLNAANW